jgi:UDP-N-acetylglucosamine 2-epimerase (non-hydrolysing)
MKTKKISFIFGTRPEAIKLCPLILKMNEWPDFEPHVCVTGQHREMLDQVLQVFDIHPHADLNLMTPDQTLASLTSKAISMIDAYLEEKKPDFVIVQGDTTTVFCASLAAFYHRIPVGHVEAGLRTRNKYSPFPEEINRALTTRIAEFHFSPTERSKENLLLEGINERDVFVTGNTVVDALLITVEKVRRNPPSISTLPGELMEPDTKIPIVLVTGHRRENFGIGFENICKAISCLAEKFSDVKFIYPVHLNPNVQEPVYRLLRNRKNVHLIEPLSYLPFVSLMDRSKLILTDSGGVQEEAPSLGKPVLVMRDTTERPEAIDAGTAKLVGTDKNKIIKEVSKLMTDSAEYEKMSRAHNPYGDGKACNRIIDVLRGYFKL